MVAWQPRRANVHFQGGAVDSNGKAAYLAAKAAGITSFDLYLFPCQFIHPYLQLPLL